MLNPIQFIRSSVAEAPSNFIHRPGSRASQDDSQDHRTSDGLSVRTFYEDLVMRKGEETEGKSTDILHAKSINQAAGPTTRSVHSKSTNQSKGRITKHQTGTATSSTSSSPFFQPYSTSSDNSGSAKKPSVNGLLLSAADNDMRRLTHYVSTGFDLNSTDMFGWTALHCAAQKGSFETVQLLIHSGADFTRKNSRQQSAADLASVSHHDAIASYLRELEDNYEVFDVKLLLNREKPRKKKFPLHFSVAFAV